MKMNERKYFKEVLRHATMYAFKNKDIKPLIFFSSLTLSELLQLIIYKKKLRPKPIILALTCIFRCAFEFAGARSSFCEGQDSRHTQYSKSMYVKLSYGWNVNKLFNESSYFKITNFELEINRLRI